MLRKAAIRGDIMRRITGERTIPSVIGAFLGDDSLRQLAQERGVSLVPASLDNAKPYRYFSQDALEAIGRGKPKL